MEERDDLTYKQPNQILANLGDGRFQEILDSGVDVIGASRGLAVGDLDGDGDPDLVITNSNDRAEVYENVSERADSAAGEPGPGWVGVDLGETPGGYLALGSRVELFAGGRRQSRDQLSTDSYLSQSGQTLRFGLGAEREVERITVRWSDGRRMRIERPPAGKRLRVWPPSAPR
jgi:hypothetical protein